MPVRARARRRTRLPEAAEPQELVGHGRRTFAQLSTKPALGLQMRHDGSAVNLPNNIMHRQSCFDFVLLSAHVPAELWRRKAVGVVGRGDAGLFDYVVRLGRAFLQRGKHGGGGLRRLGDGHVGEGEVEAAGLASRRQCRRRSVLGRGEQEEGRRVAERERRWQRCQGEDADQCFRHAVSDVGLVLGM